MNWKGYRRKWPNLSTILAYASGMEENHSETSARIANVLAEIQTKHFLKQVQGILLDKPVW